jgi:glycosyltransferase involved in cell wall biosynthesis
LDYPAGDVAALAERLEQLIGQPDLRRRLGARGAKRSRRHTWERVAQELVCLVDPRPEPGASVLGVT